MINQTKWKPDTCDCELIFEWDSKVIEDERIHTAISGEPCVIHADLVDPVELHNTLLKENQGKNQAIEEACQAVPKLLPEDFHFEFDAARKLKLSIARLSDKELSDINTRMAEKLEGEVQIAKK